MFELKKLDPGAVANAMERAERYRLLNEPRAAESICLDVLEIEPDHQRALVVLLLARTDQFRTGAAARPQAARETLDRITGEFERAYYAGLICERWGKALLARNQPGVGEHAYDWLREAMGHYERAEATRAPGNDDPILRYNACVRLIRSKGLKPAEESDFHPLLDV